MMVQILLNNAGDNNEVWKEVTVTSSSLDQGTVYLNGKTEVKLTIQPVTLSFGNKIMAY